MLRKVAYFTALSLQATIASGAAEAGCWKPCGNRPGVLQPHQAVISEVERTTIERNSRRLASPPAERARQVVVLARGIGVRPVDADWAIVASETRQDADHYTDQADALLRGNPSNLDVAEALMLYWAASDMGSDYALMQLVLLYFEAKHIPRDMEFVLENLDRLHAKEYAPATLMLGEIYVNGFGVPKNLPKGIGFLEEARALNTPEASLTLGRVRTDPNSEAYDLDAGIANLVEAANAGLKESFMLLGEIEEAIGNPKHAGVYFCVAAELGIDNAQAQVDRVREEYNLPELSRCSEAIKPILRDLRLLP